ncbi:MAG: hypothetical protein QM831_11695 [Kofleriaceae bacterium]
MRFVARNQVYELRDELVVVRPNADLLKAEHVGMSERFDLIW